jgi:SAM-dependent methyltransferase
VIWVLVVLAVLFVPFGLVVLFGAPYLPAHKKAIDDALSLIKVSKNGRILDLGCGDGKFLVAAAKRGYKCTGYEINIFLFLIVKLRLLKCKNANVKLGNFWNKDFPEDTEVVYVFLLDKYMSKLDEKMKREAKRLNKNLNLVSYVFKIPNKRPAKEVGGVRVYEYPANIQQSDIKA